MDDPTIDNRVPSPGSYVSRHWRGELSLAKSYWLNGVLLTFIHRSLSFVGITVLATAVQDKQTLLIGVIALTVTPLLIVTWQVVGVWRASSHHEERGGKPVWAILAKMVCVLASAYLVFATANNLHFASQIAASSNSSEERGTVKDNKGDIDREIAEYTRAITSDPTNANAYNSRGAYYIMKKVYTLAIDDFNRAIEIDPRSEAAYLNRGSVFHEQRDFVRAIADYSRAIELQPESADGYNNRGSAYSDQGDYDRALDDLHRASKIKPNEAGAFNNLGFAYYRKGDNDKAVEYTSLAISLDAKNPDAYLTRGLALSKKGEIDRAIADLRLALSQYPECQECKDELKRLGDKR